MIKLGPLSAINPHQKFILLGGDILLLIAAFYLAPALRFGVILDSADIFGWPEVLAIFIYLLFFYIFDFYNVKQRFHGTAYLMRVIMALLAANLFIAASFYIFNVRPYGRAIFALHTLLIFTFCVGWRLLYQHWRRNNGKVSRTLIVGAGPAGQDLAGMLADHPDFVLVGALDDNPEKWGQKLGGAPILGEVARLTTLLGELDTIILTVTPAKSSDLIPILAEARRLGAQVYDLPTFYEQVMGKIPVKHLSESWWNYVPLSGMKNNIYNRKVKKIADKVLALCGLIIGLPFIIVAILAIRATSPGPVFYIHRRIGLDNRPFNLVKLRTMNHGEEKNRQHAGQKNDPRITKVGRVIRFFRIDEIPQMWNVLKGDMSLIGPRALIEEEVAEFSVQIPYFSLRHAIRPGITGWAQVNYPHGATVEDALAKLEYDLFYLKNLSPLLDILIMARTIRTVLFGKGAK